MHKALQSKLIEIEPTWFHPESDQSLMRYGFSCGDGWFFLINTILLAAKSESNLWLSAKKRSEENPGDPTYNWAHEHMKKFPEDPFAYPNFEVQQVKEKFRSLRFYYSGGTESFRCLVSAMESISSLIDGSSGDLNKVSKGYVDKIISESNESS
jgi:hypothetical protein